MKLLTALVFLAIGFSSSAFPQSVTLSPTPVDDGVCKINVTLMQIDLRYANKPPSLDISEIPNPASGRHLAGEKPGAWKLRPAAGSFRRFGQREEPYRDPVGRS